MKDRQRRQRPALHVEKVKSPGEGGFLVLLSANSRATFRNFSQNVIALFAFRLYNIDRQYLAHSTLYEGGGHD